MNIYLRDRLGSTVAVVDVNGNYQQTTAYYPSGTPYQLPNVTLATAVDASTDRLHIGNKWMSHSGLNMYDNTARMHDPVLMHFASADPLYIKYPDYSPWSHCTANPVNAIDPSGSMVIADKWCQEGIRDGLSEDESKYVDFNDIGQIDLDLLQQCESTSDNFIALRTLASSSINYIFKGVNEVQVGKTVRSMINDGESQLYGQTLMPDIENAPSSDDNVYIYTSLTNSSLKGHRILRMRLMVTHISMS